MVRELRSHMPHSMVKKKKKVRKGRLGFGKDCVKEEVFGVIPQRTEKI